MCETVVNKIMRNIILRIYTHKLEDKKKEEKKKEMILRRYHRNISDYKIEKEKDMYIDNIISQIEMIQFCIDVHEMDDISFYELCSRRQRLVSHLCNIDHDYREALMKGAECERCNCKTCRQKYSR